MSVVGPVGGGEGRTEPPYSTGQFTASLLSADASEGEEVDTRYGVTRYRITWPLPTSAGAVAMVARPGPEDQRFTRTGTSTGTAR
ncbi:MAG: hypothetical protein QOE78_3771 [Alphaproteobacteria bacterium]|jgi:hypothetical protein|nr:hypothetical protein [Alphaproteobacteria bacterium]